MTLDSKTRWLAQVPLKGAELPVVRCDISQQLGLFFNAETYFSALRTRTAGQVLLAAEEVGSTQTIIQDNTAAIPDGTLCTAARQVSGRGASALQHHQCPGSRAAASAASKLQSCMWHATCMWSGIVS